MDHAPEHRSYEPPAITPLGSVHGLTQAKTLGPSDGVLWIIHNVSN